MTPDQYIVAAPDGTLYAMRAVDQERSRLVRDILNGRYATIGPIVYINLHTGRALDAGPAIAERVREAAWVADLALPNHVRLWVETQLGKPQGEQ